MLHPTNANVVKDFSQTNLEFVLENVEPTRIMIKILINVPASKVLEKLMELAMSVLLDQLQLLMVQDAPAAELTKN